MFVTVGQFRIYQGPSCFPGSNRFFCCSLGLETGTIMKAHFTPTPVYSLGGVSPER